MNGLIFNVLFWLIIQQYVYANNIDLRELQDTSSSSTAVAESHDTDDHGHHEDHETHLYVAGKVFDTEQYFCEEGASATTYTNKINSNKTACGDMSNPCYAEGYGVNKTIDCDNCVYKVDLFFQEIYNDEGKMYNMTNRHVKILNNMEKTEKQMEGGSDRVNITMNLEQRLFLNCKNFCIVTYTTTDTERKTKKFCFNETNAEKCTSDITDQLKRILGIPTNSTINSAERTTKTNVDDCSTGGDNVDTDCPKLLQEIYSNAIKANIKPGHTCKKSVKFMSFTDGMESSKCSGEMTHGATMPCGTNQMDHNTKCYSYTLPGVIPWKCDNTPHHHMSGKANLKIGNVTGKEIDMTTYVKFFDHISSGELHPSVIINEMAIDGWVGEERALCKKHKNANEDGVRNSQNTASMEEMEYYVIMRSQNCLDNFTKVETDVGPELRKLIGDKLMKLEDLTGGSVSSRQVAYLSLAIVTSLVLFVYDF